MSDARPPEVWLYRRNASHVTSHRVLHPKEKEAEIAAIPRLRRRRARAELEERWRREESAAAAETDRALVYLARATDTLRERLQSLAALNVPELRATVKADVERVERARTQLERARRALLAGDFGGAGASSAAAGRELWLAGGPLVVAVNDVLSRAAIGRAQRALLQQNVSAREGARRDLESLQRSGAGPEKLIEAAARLHVLEAEGYELADAVLREQAARLVPDATEGPGGGSGGADAISTGDPVAWEDLVLARGTRERLTEVLDAFAGRGPRGAAIAGAAGVLLFGPPGAGKSTVAKAMASRTGARFHPRSAVGLLSKASGEAAEGVTDLFARARAGVPSVVFVSEVDALLRRRGGGRTGGDDRVVGRFLAELEETGRGEGVLVVGATNRMNILDPAVYKRLLTPVEIGLPDRTGRLHLLQLLCRDVRTAPDVDLNALAVRTEGLSAAELRRLRDSARLRALGRASTAAHLEPAAVTMHDLADALDELRTRSTLVQV